jgi:fibronectin type 3 domain-containing protein
MGFGRHRASQVAWPVAMVIAAMSTLVAATPVAAVQPIAVYTGYMDTHTSSPTPNQPNPWPFTSPSNYVGSPCSGWPTSTTCWDAAAIRIDNPNSTPITGVHVIANIGGSIYDLWGSLTVPAGGILVLTETGGQNSTNFDGSDFPPNAYNSGNFADCTNNGVVPIVSVTVGGATTSYFDTAQVLDGGGHDSGHCVGSTYVSGRMDESHQWTLVSPPAQGGPTVTSLNPSAGAAAGGTQITITGSGFTGVSQVSFGATAATSFSFASDSQVTAVAPAGSGKVDVRVTAGGATSPVNQPADQYTYISPPGAPTGLSATAGNGSIRLAWTAPASNGGSAITGYDVYRGNTSGTEVLVASGVSGPPFTDGGLVNGSQYFYKVSAVNSAGEGPLSNEASATPATVPGAPQSLVAVAGNASVSLSWTAPASNGGAAVSSYNVWRSTSSGSETVLASGVSGTSYSDGSALNGITYFYKVAAVNSVGPGPLSNEASATPTAAPTVPTAPQNLTATAGNASVALSWSAPASNGGAPVSSYNVWRSTSSGGESLLNSGVSGTSFNDGSALNGITYFYKVAAVNSVGPGPFSNEASATPATVPTAPQNLTATAGNGTVSLSWTAPASNGGAAVTGYNVLRSTTSGAETLLSAGVVGTSFTDTSVSNGSTYFYKVAAVNSVGPGPVSGEVSATPTSAPTVPTAPQNLVAVAGNASVALSWSAPASNGGAAVSSYNVWRSTSSGGESLLNSGVSGTSFSDGSALNGITYFYKVAAVNSVGPGPLSNEASATPATVPGAPQNLVAVAGNGRVSLSWSAPASNGGAAVSSYNVLRATSSGAETALRTSVSGTSFTDRKVSNGTTYYYEVRAVNSVGSGPVSSEVSVTPSPAPTVPTAPQNLSASAGNASVSLSWSAPASNGGAAVTGYNVLRSTTSGAETLLSAGVVGTSFTDPGVSNGSTYFYKVAAVNSVGPGPLSNEASATPTAAPTVPTAPQNLTATAGNASVALSWSAPASNGGVAVSSYNVWRSTSSGGESLLNSGVSGTSFSDGSALNGITYFYKVAAVNSVGPGPLSNEASATPATVPTAPQNLTATAGNASVALSWSAPASNGGAAVSSYNVLRATTSGAETTLSTGVSGTSFTDTTVSNGTTYCYEVRAVNSAGQGAVSNEASATPAPTAPSAPQNLTAGAGNASVALSWTAPASNGGAAVSSYNVLRSTISGAETTLTTGVSGTGYTDITVSNGSTYYYKVTAVNSAGPGAASNEASATPQVPASAAYVRRIASVTAATGGTSITLTVGSPGVVAGHAIVVIALLSSTSSVTGALSASDTAGNLYSVGRDVNDGSAGDRLVVLVAVNVKALGATNQITLRVPSSGEIHAGADEYAGVTGIDTSAGATASSTSFSAGPVSTTETPEILVGAVGVESGSTPVWAAGWSGLPTLAISSDYLGSAYQIVNTSGPFTASGTTSGTWMTALVALKTH